MPSGKRPVTILLYTGRKSRFRMLLEKLDDRMVYYGMGEEEGSTKVYWLEYKSFAADGRVYNVLFVFQVGPDTWYILLSF